MTAPPLPRRARGRTQRRVLVVACVPLADSFIAAASQRACTALRSAGHDVRVVDLYADNFDPALPAGERELHLADVTDKPAVVEYAAHLRWADTLVFVYPTWWSGQPAMLKGFIDRVFVCGVAWHLPEGADRLRPGLRHVRRVIAVTTHGSSKMVNALEGEGGKRIITRSLRVLCHPLARTHWIAFYGVDGSTPEQRARFLARVERRISRI